MRSEADADTTGTTLDRQKEKVQMNLPQRRPAVLCLPFSNEECCGHCKALGGSFSGHSEGRMVEFYVTM